MPSRKRVGSKVFMGVWLPAETSRALDAEVARRRKADPGIEWNRSVVARDLLYASLFRKPGDDGSDAT